MVLGYFGGPFLGVIDSSIIVIGSVFLIFLAFINYILSRVIDSKATTGIISFCSAVLIVYWGQDFIYNLMQGLNIDTGILSIIIGIVFFIGAIWIIRRVGFGGFFVIFGLGLIIVGFTDLVYRQGVVLIFGVFLLLIGLWRLLKKKKIPSYGQVGPSEKDSGYRNKARALRDKQEYDYYKRADEQRAAQELAERRSSTRTQRQQDIRDKKVKKRFISRYGRRAWKRRGGI